MKSDVCSRPQGTPPQDDRSECGLVALLLGAALVVLLPAAVFLAHWGHKRSVEQELQNAADSLALASAIKLRETGRGDGHPSSYDVDDIKKAILEGNISTKPYDKPQVQVSVALHHEEHADLVRATLTIKYQSMFSLLVRKEWVDDETITKTAYAKVPSWAMGSSEWPVVIFVLHAAKSMKFSAKDTQMMLWDLAKQAVKTVIEVGLPVRLGMIIYRDKRDPIALGYNKKNRPWWSWAHFIWGTYASGTVKNPMPVGGGTAGQAAELQPPQGPIGPDQLLISPPADEHGPALQLLAGVTKAEGYTNLGLALHEAKRLLQAHPEADRRVVLFTNDRIDYFIGTDDVIKCTEGWTKYVYFRCPIYTKGTKIDGFSIDQSKIMQVAREIRTLPDAGVGFHVVQMATKDWMQSAADRFKAGAIWDVVKRGWNWVRRNLLRLPKALNDLGLPAQREFFKNLAGAAGDADGADEKYWSMLEQPGQPGVLTGAISRNVCRFDPLDGTPESDEQGPGLHARFAFVRDEEGQETRLSLVAQGVTDHNEQGFEPIAGKHLEVALTPAACRKLGRDRAAKLVIRWGTPRLVSAEEASGVFE